MRTSSRLYTSCGRIVYAAFIAASFGLAHGLDDTRHEQPIELYLTDHESRAVVTPRIQGQSSHTCIYDEPSLVGENVLSSLSELLHTLQSTWFELWLGTWPESIDWTGAVVNTQMISALNVLSAARSNASSPLSENDVSQYFGHTAAYYFGEDATALRSEAYDDMLWVVLSWLESIKFIEAYSDAYHDYDWYGKQHIEGFAHRANIFYNLTTSGWGTNLCGGGMTWNPKFEPYKNAVTNQLFITASISMYLHFPGDAHNSSYSTVAFKRHDKRFLNAALAGYSWLHDSNMTNSQGLYVDGYHISNLHKNYTNMTLTCDDRNEMVYTYNQGIILSGLAGMFQVTGNSTFLQHGHALVNNTMLSTGWNIDLSLPGNSSRWQGLGRKGILEDICDSSGTCSQDVHTFKSVYFHHLGLFCASTTGSSNDTRLPHLDASTLAWHEKSCSRYTAWVRHNACAALFTRDMGGRVGGWWGARDVPHKHDTESAVRSLLPVGAIDYKNDRRAMEKLRKRSKRLKASLEDTSRRKLSHRSQITFHDSSRSKKSDLNDRGRGRTVESHAGGLAVVRCLWQLQQLEH